MKIFTERLYTALEKELYIISSQSLPETDKLKAEVKICKKAMSILKRYISSYFFISLGEEILFFKEIKPLFYSQYIYYISIYNFHIKKPVGGIENLSEYVNSELESLKRFFDQNQSFFQYYRMSGSHFDNYYFTRSGLEICTDLEDYQADEMFSTSHDYKLSKIIANERYREYLNIQVSLMQTSEKFIRTPIVWTSNQTDLVELIYALVETGAFNNGNIEIKNLMDYFQSIFQVDLKYYYRKYTDITCRKKERTVFLDKLKFCLMRKMEGKEEYELNNLKRINYQ